MLTTKYNCIIHFYSDIILYIWYVLFVASRSRWVTAVECFHVIVQYVSTFLRCLKFFRASTSTAWLVFRSTFPLVHNHRMMMMMKLVVNCCVRSADNRSAVCRSRRLDVNRLDQSIRISRPIVSWVRHSFVELSMTSNPKYDHFLWYMCLLVNAVNWTAAGTIYSSKIGV